LVKRVVNPSFEIDANIVLPPPREAAFGDCEKVVERDVELYWEKVQSV
jgi:hypothetical protein